MAANLTSEQTTAAFLKYILSDTRICNMLLESLQKAKSKARQNLDQKLYEVLEWPTTLDEYEKYLIKFTRWSPIEGIPACWIDPKTGMQREIINRHLHFYWLVGQKVGQAENEYLQSIPEFHQWLVMCMKNWGSYLDTTDSFNEGTIQSFLKNAPQYNVEDSLVAGKPNNPSGWQTFNQFFARHLNPGLRKIAHPHDNLYICSPADCIYLKHYHIDLESNLINLNGQKVAVKIKETHAFRNVKDLISRSAYSEIFSGGTLIHYSIMPYSYHRFHCPVSGIIKEIFKIDASSSVSVVIEDGQFTILPDIHFGATFHQTRGVMIIDTKDSNDGDVGIVAIIPVGVANALSVNMCGTPGQPVKKGDEFGHFAFGGSDIILIIQAKDRYERIEVNDRYIHYGEEIIKVCAV